MLNNIVVVRRTFFLGLFLPQRFLHRLKLYTLVLCLIGSAAGITVVAHEQSNQVLLVSSADVQQSVAMSRGTFNASKALIRVNQLDPNQYASKQDYSTWAYSTCSAAAMTEVINAYGYHYRIADILKIEAGLGEITSNQGLLEPSGIDRTADHFGFVTQTLNSPTLDQVITLANAGKPVIVSFPAHPATAAKPEWTTGHILVVLGGDSAHVRLADSSSYDLQSVSRSYFLTYWEGMAKILAPKVSSPETLSSPAPATSYSVIGKPTITAAFINTVLAAHHSPAVGSGQALYDLGVKYDIDPAFALAFFLHESSFGTAGEAQKTKSLGNLRCYPGATCVDQSLGGYASYPTWEAGFEAWYRLIRNYYVTQLGKTTVDQIIPTYAPPGDNNNDSAYINSLKQAIIDFRAGIVMP